MPSLEPIPIPLRLRWREFKIRLLPLLVFTTVAASAVMFWRSQLGPRGVIGQVELIETRIGAVKPVVVSAVLVKPHQFVRFGDPLVRVLPENPALLTTTLESIRAEATSIRNSFTSLRPQNQMIVDFERLRLESLDFKAQLAVAKVEAALAETEANRGRALAQSKVMSEEELGRLEAFAEAQRLKVEELAVLAKTSEESLANVSAVRSSIDADSPAQVVASDVDFLEKKLRMVQAELGEMLITAPIDGEVGAIHYQNGAVVPTGEPIFTIAATKPTVIVAYLRQPVISAPKSGDKVEVRTRAKGRPFAESRVASVSSRMEPLSPALFPLANIDVRAPELALHVRIPVPPGLEVRPGEIVEVVFLGSD